MPITRLLPERHEPMVDVGLKRVEIVNCRIFLTIMLYE